MLLLVAFSAIIIPLVLIVLLRLPAKYSMPVSALSVALLGSAVWGMDGYILGASTLQGIHRALTILWILAGAIFFLYVMQRTGATERIKQSFSRISVDMRVQVVLICFSLIAIIEGVSGFGTPAAIIVPLLLALGFHPLSSVVLALVGDSVPTSFGALGTPITVGLSNIPDPGGSLLSEVASKIVVIDALFGLMLPLVLVTILVVAFGRKSERRTDIAEMVPWSLLVGAVYVVTAIAGNFFLGYEFTSVIAGVVSLAFGVWTVKHGILQPKVAWRHHALEEDREIRYEKPTLNVVKAWLPYALIVGLLLLQRFVPVLREFSLTAVDWSWQNILRVPQISSQWQVIHSPGTTLIIVALATVLIFPERLKTIGFATGEAAKKLLVTGAALIATLIMVQIFANSGMNSMGHQSMPVYIAETLAEMLGPAWLIVAPFIGTVAAFVMGSSTVSTLTMSPVQYSVAMQVGMPVDVGMAQQISGANAGNMIAIHNVVAASAVSGLHHQEWRIIRHTLPIVFVYLACTVLMAGVVILLTLW